MCLSLCARTNEISVGHKSSLLAALHERIIEAVALSADDELVDIGCGMELCCGGLGIWVFVARLGFWQPRKKLLWFANRRGREARVLGSITSS